MPADVRATSSGRHSSGGSVRPRMSAAASEKPSMAAHAIVSGPTIVTRPATHASESRPDATYGHTRASSRRATTSNSSDGELPEVEREQRTADQVAAAATREVDRKERVRAEIDCIDAAEQGAEAPHEPDVPV